MDIKLKILEFINVSTLLLSLLFLILTDIAIIITIFKYNNMYLLLSSISFIIMTFFSTSFILSGIKIANYQKN